MEIGKYDFAGWATRNDLKCADGRTIRRNAFADCDGKQVPLVWNHNHEDPECVLGHGLLKNCDEGVRFYGFFNDTPNAKTAKTCVESGDINALSIYANHLKQSAMGDVLHGTIREVSLVLAGANPGAFIDDIVVHSDSDEGEAFIYTDESLELYHADDPDSSAAGDKAEPKEDDSAFVPLDNIDLSNILCIRSTRTILNGNMISWNNNYYQILDKDNSIKKIYKGTEVQVFENVLTKVVRVKYYNIFYNTKQIEGHRQDPVKREQMKIDNQKQLEQVLRERDERLKARANKVSS